MIQSFLFLSDVLKGKEVKLKANPQRSKMLAEIKSRILLPRPEEDDEEEDDPRAQLIRRLQEYERYRLAAEDLDELPRMERDLHQCGPCDQ